MDSLKHRIENLMQNFESKTDSVVERTDWGEAYIWEGVIIPGPHVMLSENKITLLKNGDPVTVSFEQLERYRG